VPFGDPPPELYAPLTYTVQIVVWVLLARGFREYAG
jgi:hypothetical protein